MRANLIKIKRALVSISNKDNIKLLAKIFNKYNVEVLSTGGSAKVLKRHQVNVTEVSSYTNFPEILDGRVKTLHPKIHGALLARSKLIKHKNTMKEYDIKPINLILVNLYPFLETVKKKKNFETCIENIDIGGPAMIRSAAKNHENVCVIIDPKDYLELENILKKYNGSTNLEFRKRFASKAFSYTAYYDSIISQWFNKELNIQLPEKISIAGKLSSILRYGENPHQKAAMYELSDVAENSIINAKKLQGKPLSYNNINDANAALELINDFPNPTVAIIKHANPCGVATGNKKIEIWKAALKTDPISAFGGIVVFNREIDKALAHEMNKLFLELVIAPKFSAEAIKIFSSKNNLRVIQQKGITLKANGSKEFKQLDGGFLMQDKDTKDLTKNNLNIVTKRKPSKRETNDLLFAFRIAKHVKSNAIIYAKNGSTVGIGAGQMSRIDSTKIAIIKAKEASNIAKLKVSMINGSVVASDAFFPFDDGLIAAAKAGITAVIQPGGSIRDKEVIKTADKLGISMIFTGIRHFKH